jgi:hypothetical protein
MRKCSLNLTGCWLIEGYRRYNILGMKVVGQDEAYNERIWSVIAARLVSLDTRLVFVSLN